MTTIRPTPLLIAQIQAQAAAWRRLDGRDGSPPPEAGASRDGSPVEWALHLAEAVGSIRPDDPERHRKAFRAYLHSVLGRECGFRTLDDPGLLELVERTQEAMERDPVIRSAIERAGAELLKEE